MPHVDPRILSQYLHLAARWRNERAILVAKSVHDGTQIVSCRAGLRQKFAEQASAPDDATFVIDLGKRAEHLFDRLAETRQFLQYFVGML